MRYRYIAYKYTRKARPEATFQNMWESFGSWPMMATIVWRPPTDVYETPDEIMVVIELAGVAEDAMTVTLFSDLLVVEGRREQPVLADMNACLQLGIKYGDFRSEVQLSGPVDKDKVTAEYKNGLLKITFKKLD
ncbi:MAG TPA: Hsp20/alpha crystallin family protein [Nitrospirota bacterium]|nr:Hsp20/alpha crystallin family protein [Nitrospirota bacterium]